MLFRSTVNTLVYVAGRGLVIDEPSAIAIDKASGAVTAVGEVADVLAGKEPQGVNILHPLRDGVVAQHHWLTQGQFLDAVAMGLITPGPVVITAAFIGYKVGGFPGALIATVAIFTPIWLGVVLPGRWFIRHRDNPQVKAFVTGATAALRQSVGLGGGQQKPLLPHANRPDLGCLVRCPQPWDAGIETELGDGPADRAQVVHDGADVMEIVVFLTADRSLHI